MAMELATRPWIAAGVALVGAGVIIVTPVRAAVPNIAVPNIKVAAVQLTDSPEAIDPITAIEDVLKLAQTNSVAIDDHFSPVPLPTLQQIIADLLDGKTIDLQAAGNAAITPFLPGAGLPPGEMPPAFLYSSLNPIHSLAFSVVEKVLTNPDLQSLLTFTASPLSGVLLGDLGPILDPGLALENSIQDALTAPDPQSALNDLLNIPANIADATLNGEFLDGTTPEINILSLLSLLPAGTLPPNVDITSLDLVMGGLLSPGGSLFNGIGATVSGLSVPGTAVGPIGSSIELDQAIATALGFSFPTPATDTVSPLGDLLSTLTTELDGGLSTAFSGLSTDFSALLTDGLGNLGSLF
jgi:hypothetical protein